MSEHYTKLTVEASVWCNPCGKVTRHRVDNGRRGPCLECIAKREKEAKDRKPETPRPSKGGCFDHTLISTEQAHEVAPGIHRMAIGHQDSRPINSASTSTWRKPPKLPKAGNLNG